MTSTLPVRGASRVDSSPFLGPEQPAARMRANAVRVRIHLPCGTTIDLLTSVVVIGAKRRVYQWSGAQEKKGTGVVPRSLEYQTHER